MPDLPTAFAHLNARVASLEWATDAANGSLEGLDWIDANVDPTLEGFQFEQSEEGKRYRHRPLGYFLPTIMSRMALQSQKNGDPTILEAVIYLYARVEWLSATRKYFWSPSSPVPGLLVLLAEVYGIGQELHRNDPHALSRLIARVPSWHKDSGTALKAKELFTEIIGRPLPIQANQSVGSTELAEEIFVARDWKWWKAHKRSSSKTKLRITSGFLQFQSHKAEEQFPMIREDVFIVWKIGVSFPKDFLRLLPIWACVRIMLKHEKE